MKIELSRTLPARSAVAIIPVIDGAAALPVSLGDPLIQSCKANMEAVAFKAEEERSLDVSTQSTGGLHRLVLVGLNRSPERPLGTWERLGARVIREAARLRATHVAIIMPEALALEGPDQDAVLALALGARLAKPSENPYRSWSGSNTVPLDTLTIVVPIGADLVPAERVKEIAVIADAVRENRRRIMAPSNVMTPRALIAEAEALRSEGVAVDIFVGDDALEHCFPGTRAVGSGSARESGAAIMTWMGKGADEPVSIGFSGKGVTFDSGGFTAKSEFDQRLMKVDMCGASTVISVMSAIARLKLPINVVAGFGAVENISGSAAYKSGDILQMANGTSVEVTFPDAEGRLVMADINCFLADRYDPAVIVNVAALTYTAVSALGDDCMALFANDDGLSADIMKAANEVGELFWRLPVGPRYLRLLDSHIADLKNMVAANQWGLLAGSASAASEFLRHFAGNRKWANLDILAAIWRSKDHSLAPAGATGEPVRTLIRWLQNEAGHKA